VFAILVAAGVLGLGLAVVLMTGDDRGKIERRLGDLMNDAPPAEEEEEVFVARGDQAFAETAVMQRMVGLTGRLAERAGLLSRTEDALEQADLPLRPPEALFFYFIVRSTNSQCHSRAGGNPATVVKLRNHRQTSLGSRLRGNDRAV
ncbi:MAG: hypothetical protein ABI854_09130, partial [Betaproteobacteria bacterium]